MKNKKADLEHFRHAIREHVETIRHTVESQVAADALLVRCPGRSFQAVGAGDKEPLPYL